MFEKIIWNFSLLEIIQIQYILVFVFIIFILILVAPKGGPKQAGNAVAGAENVQVEMPVNLEEQQMPIEGNHEMNATS